MDKWIQTLIVAIAAVCFIGIAAPVANFLLTQPSTGTTFASNTIGSAQYVDHVICDATNGNATPSTSCATVASGAVATTVANVNANGSATSANSSPVVIASDQAIIPVAPNAYPASSTPITATATGTTAATTATMAATASVTNYLCGLSIRANATAAATGNATVTGTITGTINFTQWTAPAASGLGVIEEVFIPCVPASATNTAIAVISAAPGTGGIVSVTAWGYRK